MFACDGDGFVGIACPIDGLRDFAPKEHDVIAGAARDGQREQTRGTLGIVRRSGENAREVMGRINPAGGGGVQKGQYGFELFFGRSQPLRLKQPVNPAHGPVKGDHGSGRIKDHVKIRADRCVGRQLHHDLVVQSLSVDKGFALGLVFLALKQIREEMREQL